MPDQPTPIDNTDIEKSFKAKIEVSKTAIKQRAPEWKRNIELRMGRETAFATMSTGMMDEEAQSTINPDWSLTKTKTANLYSQVPTVQGTHENKQYAAAIPPFMKQLNYELGDKRAHVGVAMEEILNDAVNAAGIGAAFVGYAARFEPKEMPVEDSIPGPQGPIPTKSLPPEALQPLIAANIVHMQTVQKVVDDKFFVSRISPTDLLTPSEFTGSCFDDGDWIGHTDRMGWADGVNEFGLKDADKDKVLGGDDPRTETDLRISPEKSGLSEIRKFTYDELFYWRYRVDPDEKSFRAIWRLVFVHGLDESVKHEPWKGQKLEELSQTYIGACKFPIQVLTLTYISDNSVPPSDSSAGRPQVLDMQRSRSQMFLNRKHSIPIRGYDTNIIDPLIQAQLMRGTFQGWIPCNGSRQNSVWEVARASYPGEDLSFDQLAKADLMESWQIGPNQLGTARLGSQTATETQTVQANFATRIGQERGRVAAFFLNICEVLAGLMVLYSEFPILTEQERARMQQAWDQKHILHDLVLKIRPDSQVVLDVGQRLDRIFKFINMTGKSQYVNVKPLLIEAAELSGLDPSEIIIDPRPRVEEEKISFSFSGKDDLINPLVMALLVEKHQAPSPQSLDIAKKILTAAQVPPEPPPPPGIPAGAEGPVPPDALPPAPGGPPGHDARPDWSLMPHITKRERDAGSSD